MALTWNDRQELVRAVKAAVDAELAATGESTQKLQDWMARDQRYAELDDADWDAIPASYSSDLYDVEVLNALAQRIFQIRRKVRL